jgi:hypothetical protein
MDLTPKIDLPKDEKEEITADAAAAGLSVSVYIRAVLIDYTQLREWAEVKAEEASSG